MRRSVNNLIISSRTKSDEAIEGEVVGKEAPLGRVPEYLEHNYLKHHLER